MARIKIIPQFFTFPASSNLRIQIGVISLKKKPLVDTVATGSGATRPWYIIDRYKTSQEQVSVRVVTSRCIVIYACCCDHTACFVSLDTQLCRNLVPVVFFLFFLWMIMEFSARRQTNYGGTKNLLSSSTFPCGAAYTVHCKCAAIPAFD